MIIDTEPLLQNMTLQQRICQMFFVSYPFTEMREEWEEFYREYPVGGVVLSERNCIKASQTKQLIADLQDLARETGVGVPLSVVIDQEGGALANLTFGRAIVPSSMALSATRNSEYVYEAARHTAQELKSYGFTLNLAPIVDINSSPLNPILGIRSFGETEELVSQLGTKAIKGFQENGVGACARHFPGHGATDQDSTFEIPSIPYGDNRLEQQEFKPFKAAIGARVEAVMVGHLCFSALDRGNVPASLSVRLISQYLRNSLNFKGVVMTDFIDKPSITNIFPLEEAGMRAVKAGNDIILIDNPDYIINVGTGIMEGIGNREFSEDKLIEANRRILRQKFRRSYEPSPYHEDPTESIRRMSRDSITLVRNDQNLLPFKLRDEGWVTVINPTAPNRDYLTLGECLLSRHNWVEEVQYDQAVEDLDFQEVKERSQNSDLIILVLDSRAALPEHQIGWSRRVKLQGKPVVVVAMGSPYNLVQIPEITTYVVTYGYSPYSLEAVIEVMTGEVNPKGRLPVALGDLYPIGHGLSYPGGANVQ